MSDTKHTRPSAPADSGWRPNHAEIQSGLDRVKWAEALIAQLPKDHDGRNSWLLNYGVSEEAVAKRDQRGLTWNEQTRSAGTPAASPDAPDLIGEALKVMEPFANIHLRRDHPTYDPTGPDCIDAPDLAITPKQVRAARDFIAKAKNLRALSERKAT